jgi:hypothetical protein
MKVKIQHMNCPMDKDSRKLADVFIKFLQKHFPLKHNVKILFLGERIGGMTTGSRSKEHVIKILTKKRKIGRAHV